MASNQNVKAATAAINKAQKELSAARIAEAADKLGTSTPPSAPVQTAAAEPTPSVSAEPMLNQLNTAQQEVVPTNVGRPTRARTPRNKSKGIMMANK